MTVTINLKPEIEAACQRHLVGIRFAQVALQVGPVSRVSGLDQIVDGQLGHIGYKLEYENRGCQQSKGAAQRSHPARKGWRRGTGLRP
jgi:hypothetical protein